MAIRDVPTQSLSQIVDQAANLIRTERKGALEYVPELAWMLFLKVADAKEREDEEEAIAIGHDYESSIPAPFRWRDWVDTGSSLRDQLTGTGSREGDLVRFVNDQLFPKLTELGGREGATRRQLVVSEIFRLIGRTQIRTEKTLLDALDIVDRLDIRQTDDFHLSEAYEALLLKLGEKNSDGGQFFTPRDVIRAVVQIVNPRIGQTVCDPCAGTGGFLGIAYEHMLSNAGANPEDIRFLKEETFFAREMEDRAIPMGLANLVLHGIDGPHFWHGNTLTRQASSSNSLWKGAPELFDVILTNPPFGGKETASAQQRYAYRTKASQVLFLQEVMDSLAQDGKCGLVIDEGVLFQTNQTAFVQTKKRLLTEFNLWGIVSLPPGVFSCAGAGVKTNLLFFERKGRTEKIWYYDLSDLKIGKKNPLTLTRMEGLLHAVKTLEVTERSWFVTLDEIEAKEFDLKAVNPNRKVEIDPRTSSEILAEIEARHKEISDTLTKLRALIG